MTLYEMTEQGRMLYEMMEAGEIDESTFRDTLEAIGADEKIDTYCALIRQREADAEMLKIELERFRSRAQAAEKDVERMKEALKEFMLATGQSKAKTPLWSVSAGKSVSVDVLDAQMIPDEYYVPQPPKLNKADILRVLKSGEEVAGATLKENVTLRIK
jgi:HSP90 family molecular chaperone